MASSGIAAPSGASGELRGVGSQALVAYFSRSGNTRVVAGLIHRALHTGGRPRHRSSVFVMEADQERRTMDQVNRWLSGIKINT